MNKIAIIEDDIDICNMIAKFLENNKYIVHYALNGAEGIELCKSLVPDLIILDIMLPKKYANHNRKGKCEYVIFLIDLLYFHISIFLILYYQNNSQHK